MFQWFKEKFGFGRSKPARKTVRRRVGRASSDQLAAAIMQVAGDSGAYYSVPQGGAGMGMIEARYDLAQTTDGNRKHWIAADGLSAEAANSLGIRRILRNRTRYEVANNSYVKGIVGTLATDTVGIGPRLQMLAMNRSTSSRVEADFASWAKEVKLAKKLRQMRRARCETGESFLVAFYNPKINHPVKLDIVVVESDRVTDSGFEYNNDPLWCDGIRYDEYGNPVSYRILKHHPGSTNGVWAGMADHDDYPAEYVYHDFKDDERPGQRRGVPELTPSIQTGGQLRRYDDAVLRTAEVHARMALALETDTVPELEDGENPELPENMDKIELPDSGAIVLPPGMKLHGVEPMQPTDKHRDFVDVKIRETARCINMPFTIAALDSSQSNLSARYLDSQIYASSIKVDRFDCASECLDWLFLRHWVREYWLVRPNVPRGEDRYPHTWYWPSLNQHADPSKVAKAQESRIGNATTSTDDEISENGNDWEETFEKEARVLGITVPQYQGLLRLKRFGTADPNGAPMAPPAPAGEAELDEEDDDDLPPVRRADNEE